VGVKDTVGGSWDPGKSIKVSEKKKKAKEQKKGGAWGGVLIKLGLGAGCESGRGHKRRVGGPKKKGLG